MCWETILHGALCFCTFYGQRRWLSHHEYLYGGQSWRRQSPPAQKTGMPSAMHKHSDSLSSWLLSYSLNHWCEGITWPSLSPSGNWGSGNKSKKRLTLWLLLLLRVLKSSVSDPEAQHLLPTSMKLRQSNLLACKRGKISNPSLFCYKLF